MLSTPSANKNIYNLVSNFKDSINSNIIAWAKPAQILSDGGAFNVPGDAGQDSSNRLGKRNKKMKEGKIKKKQYKENKTKRKKTKEGEKN